MKKKLLETILETIEDINTKYDRILKDMERFVVSSQNTYSISLENKEKIDIIANELEKKQNSIIELNKKIDKQDNDINEIKKTIDEQIKLKKTLSSILYDFHSFKQDIQRKFALLENKVILLEAKSNMNKTASLEKEITSCLNELKDTVSITMRNLNTKINEINNRIDGIGDRQKIYEIMIKLSVCNEKDKISDYLKDFQVVYYRLKQRNYLDEDFKNYLKDYFSNMISFWSSNGFNDIAQMFLENKIEIEN